MKNRFLHTFFIFCIAYTLSAQNIWSNQLDRGQSNNPTHIQLRPYGDRVLLLAGENSLEFDVFGTVTGAFPSNPNKLSSGRLVLPKIDPKTGQRYFLLGMANFESGRFMLVFEEYWPEKGFVNKQIFDDKLSPKVKTPSFLPINDSMFWALGNRFVRQFVHRPKTGVVMLWEKRNYAGDFISVMPSTGGGCRALTTNGSILSFGANGDSLGVILLPGSHVYQSMIVEDNHLIVCGGTAGGLSKALKINTNGNMIWERSFAEDLMFYDLAAGKNGEIALVGQSKNKTAVRLHLDANGNTLWRKTYLPGIASALLSTDDGGFWVAGTNDQSKFFILKTNDSGETGPFKVINEFTNRSFENERTLIPFSPSPSLFFDYGNREGYWVDKKNKLGFIEASSIWLGATEFNSLKVAASKYFRFDGIEDFQSGIIGTLEKDMKKVWALSRNELNALQQDWADNGKLDQPIPFDILSWPACGNPHFNQNLDFSQPSLDKKLLPAPFFDFNGDSLYNVFDGDLPLMKGDQMAWWILNDDKFHQHSFGPRMKVELTCSAYLFDCTADEVIRNTLFVDFEVINKSGAMLNNMYMGIWSDFDLGCAYDDYIGCIPKSNAYYVYNRDTLDQLCNGLPNYKDQIPVGSVAMLNQNLSYFMYHYATSPNEKATPIQDIEHYNYLKGFWRDGSLPIINGARETHLYPGNPADPAGYSMCNEPPLNNDLKAIGSHGPFTMQPNDTFLMQLAYTYHPNIAYPCPDIFGRVKNDIDALKMKHERALLAYQRSLPAQILLQAGQNTVLDAATPGATAYNWSNGATTAAITVSQAGQYTVSITRSIGCPVVETVTVRSATNLDEPPSGFTTLKVYPNPNKGQFWLNVAGESAENLDVTVFNTIGQIVHYEQVGFGLGQRHHGLALQQLPAGLYTLRVQAGRQLAWQKVVIGR